MNNIWIKLDSFKLQNGSIADIEIRHPSHKAMPELRISYGYLTEWPVYCPSTGKVLYDHPEQFPKKVQDAVERLYKKLALIHKVGA